MRSFNRGALDLRPVTLTPAATRYAEGSTQVEFGHTRVLVTCSVEEQGPAAPDGQGHGLGDGRVRHAAALHAHPHPS